MAWTFYTDGAEKVQPVSVTNNTARVYSLAGQSIPTSTDATYYTVAFELETFDYGNLHDNVTNNSRLTAAVAGVYFIYSNITFDVSTAGDRVSRLKVNGSTPISRSAAVTMSQGAYTKPVVDSTLYYLDVGDYVEVEVSQSSGAALTLTGSAAWRTHFGMAKIS